MNKMKVLSLFDGISCGMLALQRAGIAVEEYHAFEIDKYALQVSEKNFPLHRSEKIRHNKGVELMALDKAIISGKEHRKPYKGGKAVDISCRNHGSCPYCKGNRLYKLKKQLEKIKYCDRL